MSIKKLARIKTKAPLICPHCDGKGTEMTYCGGDRYSMWECARNLCNIKHKEVACDECNGKGYKEYSVIEALDRRERLYRGETK